MRRVVFLLVVLVGCLTARAGDAPLPAGVRAVWDVEKAVVEKTGTRERVCLNGLWRWQPATGGEKKTDTPPTGDWGFVKVPGPWMGCKGDWMWNNTQTSYPHPAWGKMKFETVNASWYEREFTVPAAWAGRRVTLTLEYLNSVAAICVDGKDVAEAFYPGGEVDITAAATAGKHRLDIFVAAVPLGEESSYFAESGLGPRSKAKVGLRGLCGDVFLNAVPAGARVADVQVTPSVRNWTLTVNAGIEGLDPAGSYSLHAKVLEKGRVVKDFGSTVFKGGEVVDGRITFAAPWKPEKLWDTITPQNQYNVEVTLLDAGQKAVDSALPVRFGFRELWIDGRDWRLNGTRITCFALPLDSAQISPAAATYQGASETFRRLKAAGVNLVYTHNYGCEPGTHLAFGEILRAADDAGMLVAFSLPHVSSYDWKKKETEQAYTRHVEWYVRQAQNHPSVIAYAMSHNLCGYDDEHNPDHMDGMRDMTGQIAQPSDRNAKLALRGEAIARKFDGQRIIYHHGSGNLGEMYVLNIYLNHVPAQERDDWFEHWAKEGVKPLFWGEYGTPSPIDWSMYRGWYKGERSWGNAAVAYEMCFPEWGAQYRGDKAFNMTELEKDNLRFEAKQWKKLAKGGSPWYRWDYPHQIPSYQFDIPNILDVQAAFVADNWRCFRTWGVTAFNSWEWNQMWDVKPGFKWQKKVLATDWERLQQPGYSPDFIDKQYEVYEYAFEQSDWVPTVAAKAVLQNNTPVLAYIGGGPERFSNKDHDYLAGQAVEKQIIVLNNSRQAVTAECAWTLGLPQPLTGSKHVAIETGEQARIPLQFQLPASLPAGSYTLTLTAKFNNGHAAQTDAFVVDVLPAAKVAKAPARIALFDPKNQTRALVKDLGVQATNVDAGADLSGFDLLIVGKLALSADGMAPDISRVREGLKVLVLEQSAETLQNRFGFRVTEYGLRQVFKRVPDHPALAGLSEAALRDWRGEATLTPSRLAYTFEKYKSPTIEWCGIPVTRAWRCGNSGNVASVLIEKPARGDFLPIVDGGYSLQYSPLMEYREGRGVMVFCQMDVTGRTQSEPAANLLMQNLLGYLAGFKAGVARRALFAGSEEARAHLEKCGVALEAWNGGEVPADAVAIVAPSAGKVARVQGGGRILALGFSEPDAAGLPTKIATKKGEYMDAVFDPPAMRTAFAGVGPADLHNRDPRVLQLITSGGGIWSAGPAARSEDGAEVFLQLLPWDFEYAKQYNLKRTFRRSSFALSRVLANLGVQEATPMLERFHAPAGKKERRYLEGLYLDQPEEMDDPYRYFCW